MQRYKESLGLGGGGQSVADPNDPRVCIILSLTMDSEGQTPVTIDLSEKGAEVWISPLLIITKLISFLGYLEEQAVQD